MDPSIRRWPNANLIRNPFGELTRRERAELAVVDLLPILDHLTEDGRDQWRPRTAYQVMGECGRGKTTHMVALTARFEDAVYVYLAENAPCPAIPAGSPLLIDEAQRLPRAVLRTLCRDGVTLILGTHRDLSRPLRRSGYDVITQRIGLTLSAVKLAKILNRRIDASRRDRGLPVPTLSVDVAERLIVRFGTDIRGIEGYLYDIVQSQVEHHGEMRFIG
ncbi:MAG: hypothetical protein AAFU85_12800 [Planctomycetota bacterium]